MTLILIDKKEISRSKIVKTVIDQKLLSVGNRIVNFIAVMNMDFQWNYSKLSFNTKYPWEASPSEDVESQQYVLKDLTSQNNARANVTFWGGERDGVLYRRQFFDYSLQNECHWIQAINLADFPVANGIIRADQLRLFRRPVSLTLCNKNGKTTAVAHGEDEVSLVYSAAYQEGDRLLFEVEEAPAFYWMQVDEAKGKSLVYVTGLVDYPHDNWWKSGTIVFSDGSTLELELTKIGNAQVVSFEEKTISLLELQKMVKSEEPSPFPALVQIEVYGTEAEEQ